MTQLESEIIQSQTTSTKSPLSPKVREYFHNAWASIFCSGRPVGKHLMICSANRKEGSTTLAAGVALAGCQTAASPRVALVDMNFRFPAVHKLLGLKQSPGIAEIISGEARQDDAVKKIGNLHVFTSGSLGAGSLDLLQEQNLSQVILELSGQYDHVIYDVAAVNDYPDAQVLACALNDAVLVVRSNRTPREAVAQAKKRIELGGGKLAGVLLNMRTFPIPRFLYRMV
jgi:capsular exopolysaccharide synthesis family protein